MHEGIGKALGELATGLVPDKDLPSARLGQTGGDSGMSPCLVQNQPRSTRLGSGDSVRCTQSVVRKPLASCLGIEEESKSKSDSCCWRCHHSML